MRLLRCCRARGMDIEAETLGIRPGMQGVDPVAHEALVNRCLAHVGAYYDGAVSLGAGSTDANIPLSRGIPAVMFGLIAGGGAHTHGEWVEADSLVRGLCIALDTLLYYFDRTTGTVKKESGC